MRFSLVCIVIFVMLCFGLLFNHTHADAAPVQWIGEPMSNGHWYEAFSVPDGITWTDAQDAAILMSGNLASITSEDENKFVFNLIPKTDLFWKLDIKPEGAYTNGPWLGGYQYDKYDEPAGHWAWVDGDPWVYTNWAITNQGGQEPNNGGGEEDYVGFLHFEPDSTEFHPADTWNDYGVDNPNIISYVVEFVPEPSSFVLLGVGAISLIVFVLRRRKPAV